MKREVIKADDCKRNLADAGNGVGGGRRSCRLIDARKQIPLGARYLSLRIGSRTWALKHKADVWMWINKIVAEKNVLHRKPEASTNSGKEYDKLVNEAVITYIVPTPAVASRNAAVTITQQQVVSENAAQVKKPIERTVQSQSNSAPATISSKLASLLETDFPNGVRIGSVIDRNRIKRAWETKFGETPPTVIDWDAALKQAGVSYDGKIFPRPSSKYGGWGKVIERLVLQGHFLFQFSRVMELHAAEFMKIGIVSAGMLREAMTREASDTYEISGEFFAPKGDEKLADLFDLVFIPRDGAIIDVAGISKQVPYVDVAFIRSLYKGLPNMIRVAQDTYAIVSRIEFDDVEVARGKSCCKSSVEKDGFFSLSQLRLQDSASLNDQRITHCAFRRAFFQRFLMDSFDVHGQIVCAKGASIDGQIPLHAFLREHSDVSLEQLDTVAKEYNIAPWLALKTAHEEMVRVDRERFVAPALVTFDVPSIDESVSDVCEGRIMPFGAFTNLSDFPAVPGFAWNEYLLEAFLRRASMEFRLVSPSVPARDVSGAVVPRLNNEWSAENAFASIAHRCGVAAEAEEVGDFLVATRCVLRRSTKTVGAVVSRMKELEKR